MRPLPHAALTPDVGAGIACKAHEWRASGVAHQEGPAGSEDAAAAAHIQEAVPGLEVQLLLNRRHHPQPSDRLRASSRCAGDQDTSITMPSGHDNFVAACFHPASRDITTSFKAASRVQITQQMSTSCLPGLPVT